MPSPPIITLLTDFGTRDPFVVSMKGVILGINPDARIVDISHEVQPQNIREAAFILKSAYRYFPKGTIHLVVVDPGVGSDRKPLLVTSSNYSFIAPDNGVLSFVYEEEVPAHVYEITAAHYFLKKEGSTFHGRDRFAPVAARLSKGVTPDHLGQRIDDYVYFSSPKPRQRENRSLEGEAIYIDRFGNLITNIRCKDLDPWLSAGKTPTMTVKGQTINGLKTFYAQAAPSELAALVNSDDHLEIFIYQGNAQAKLNAASDEPVTVH